MDTIKFSTNWNNKLTNRAFTTIRIHNDNKYFVGQNFIIEMKGKNLGIAVLRKKHVIKADQINEFISYLDTGYSPAETIGILKRMYPNIDFSTALFDFLLLIYKNNKDLI